jgi:hypothetical protein
MATAREMKKRLPEWAYGTSLGTKFAIISCKGESTQVPEVTSVSDSTLFEHTNLYVECLRLEAENAKLKAENVALSAKVDAMQLTNSAEKFMEIREIPRDQAKEEVRAFFKAHDGEAIYPSDVMEALSLDYDLVYEICEELEKEGKIKGL